MMKKTEQFFMVYNLDESTMYGSFPDRESAERWKSKIEPVVECDLKVKESSLEMELPEGISFNTEAFSPPRKKPKNRSAQTRRKLR